MSPRRLAGHIRGRVISRMLRGWVHTARLIRTEASDRAPAPARPRPSSSPLVGLTRQVAAFADEGATAFEIAQRTGLSHDAIDLILHVRRSRAPELATAAGAIRSPESGPHRWIADA